MLYLTKTQHWVQKQEAKARSNTPPAAACNSVRLLEVVVFATCAKIATPAATSLPASTGVMRTLFIVPQ